MKILITRHGQTDWNVARRLQGKTDIELNDTGRNQARETGLAIKDEKIDLIIASPLKRALETAQIINSSFNAPIVEDERIMERGFGKFEGMTIEAIRAMKEEYPEINELWNYNVSVDMYGMELMTDFCARVYEFLDEIKEKYQDKTVLIVTHGGVSVPMKYYLNNVPLSEFTERDKIAGLHNCEVISFEI